MRAVRHSTLAFCAALLAVLLQVAAVLPTRAAPSDSFAAHVHLCGGAPQGLPAGHHAPMDCPRCVFCTGAHAVLAAVPPYVPPPAVLHGKADTSCLVSGPRRGAPLLQARARGPPVLG